MSVQIRTLNHTEKSPAPKITSLAKASQALSELINESTLSREATNRTYTVCLCNGEVLVATSARQVIFRAIKHKSDAHKLRKVAQAHVLVFTADYPKAFNCITLKDWRRNRYPGVSLDEMMRIANEYGLNSKKINRWL